MKTNLITLLGTAVCLAALAAWFYVAPAVGSGWVLFAAFFGCIALLTSAKQAGVAAVSGVIITAAAGFTWYIGQNLPNVGWVLGLAVLSALCTFNAISGAVKNGSQSENPNQDK